MKRIGIALSVLALIVAWCGSGYALDPLYERNGLVYLLVSDDNQTQDPLDGVYQANRIPVPAKLYYPGLTYGLGVDLNLWLHTFSEAKDNNFSAYTGPTDKVVNQKQALGYFTGAAWWHRCINQLNGSSRIPGSIGHLPCESGLTNFNVGDGSSQSDSVGVTILANSVDGDGGLKLVRFASGRWYHARDLAALGWPNNGNGTGGGWYAPSETMAAGYSNPNPYFPTSNSWKMYSDVEKRLYHKYYKHTWKPGMPASQPPAGPKVAESFEVDIKRYIRNGCFDGCGITQSMIPLPAEKWHTSQVFNRWAKSYFYARKINNSVPTNDAYIDVDSVRYTTWPGLLGYMNDPSSVDIGVSMKSATDDFVYVLGKKIAQEWLSLYYGSPITINYGKGVVSDQWWMTGGTVFVYDQNVGVIYQIERDETQALPKDKIKKVVVHTGVGNDVNDVGTDGFGNVFYTKTQLVPAKNTDFTFPMRTSVVWGNPSGSIRPGIVKYRQNIYKTVYKKDIFGAMTIEGQLQIGYKDYDQNIQYFPYSSTVDLNDISKWQKLGDPYVVYSSIGNASRTEMAVVNVATPPNVSGEKVAKLDITGPYGDDGSGFYQVPANQNALVPYQTYKFEVENYPLHNGKINQRTSTDANVDAQFRRIDRHPNNGYIGGFVSTLKILGADQNDCVKYTWRIVQVVDAAANAITPPKIIYERGVTSDYYKPYIFAALDYGEYEIQVSAKYQWYDMDQLAYGATIASLSSVLKPSAGSYDQGKAVDGTNVAKLYVKVSATPPNPVPTGNVVIYRNKAGSWVTQDANGGASIGPYFITTDLSNEQWKVEDPTAAQLVKAIRNQYPPNPGDVHLRPGTLQWSDNNVEVNWSAKILNPVLPLQNGVYYAPSGIPFIGKTKKQTLTAYPSNTDNYFSIFTGLNYDDSISNQWKETFGIPSDPCFYELRCSAERNFVWESITYTYQQDPYGNLVPVPGPSVPRSSKVSFTGIARVLVLDRTQPIASETVVTPKYLYAETGGTINGTVEGVTVNPTNVVIEVPDGNPMAWLTWERTEVPAAWQPVHKPTVRQAQFWYEAAGATNQTMATTSFAVPQANVVVVASGARSLYRITIPKTSLTAPMPIHRAIHLKNQMQAGTLFYASDVNFQPLGYGLNFLRDTSNQTRTFTTGLGETHLIDTIRPNAIIGVSDEKYSITRWVPDSSVFGQFAGYAWVNNTQVWNAGSNQGSVNVNGTIVSPLMIQMIDGPQPIEVDTPITFTLYGRDNINIETAVELNAFSIQQLTPAPAGAVEALTRPVHRKIFRMDTSGTSQGWVISGTVKDKALGMPSAPQAPYSGSTSYPLRQRERSISMVPFTVHNTTLDVRIIEKNNR